MSMSRAGFVAGVCVASLSFAQAVQGEAPPPLPSTARPPDAPAAPVEAPYKVGVRVGGSAGIGAWIPGMISFHLFDLHGGVQVSPLFGAYLRVGYNASVGLGVTVSASGASVSAAAAGMWLVGANAELGLGDSFFLAGGPQVGFGSWARSRVEGGSGGGSVQAIVSNGAHPGFNFKLGVGLGQPNKQTKRRTQATIAFDLSLLYAPNVTEGNIGASQQGASVSVSFSEALAVVPTLHVGFEFR